MSGESLAHMLTLLEVSSSDWDAVLVQEGPNKNAEERTELEGGHLWYVAPCGSRPRSVAILLNKRWCCSSCPPKFKSTSGRQAEDVDMRGLRLRLLTCHLPHADHSDIEYEASLSCLESSVLSGRACKRHLVVGIDANAVVGQQDAHDSSRIIGKGGLHSRNERGVSFAAWLHLVHLAACNTMFDKPHSKQWTHQMWSTGTQRQIDYIY